LCWRDALAVSAINIQSIRRQREGPISSVAIDPEELDPAQPKLAHKAATGAFWIGIETFGAQAISLLTFVIMSHFVNPGDFGLVSVTFLLIYSIRAIMIDNVIVAIVRKKRPSEIEYATGFWLSVSATCVATILFILLAGMIEQLMRAPGLASIMREMSPVLLFIGLARAHEMRLNRSFRFRTLAFRGILGPLLGGAVGITLGIMNYGLSALVIQHVATAAISLILVWTSSSWRPAFAFENTSAMQALRFVWLSVPGTIITLASLNCDTFLVAYFFGISNVGVYTVAKRLKFALQTIVTSPFNGVLLSVLAEIQDDAQRLRDGSRKMIALTLFVSVPIFVGSALISKEVILLFFGERWETVAPVFATLALGGVFVTPQTFCDTVFSLKNRQIWSFYYMLLYTALAVALFFWLRSSSPDYIALPFVLPYLFVFPFSAYLVSKLIALSLSDWLRAVAPSTLSAIVMFAIVKLVTAQSLAIGNFWGIFACSAIGGLVYLAAMFVFDRMTLVGAFHSVGRLLYQDLSGHARKSESGRSLAEAYTLVDRSGAGAASGSPTAAAQSSELER
jgi:O-antigen/teichoic acid export membrane protein